MTMTLTETPVENLSILDVLAWIEDYANDDDKKMLCAALDIGFQEARTLTQAGTGLLNVKVGDRVVVTNCKPAYLKGATGTVIRITGGKVNVDLDRGYGHSKYTNPRDKGWRFFHNVGFKPTMLALEPIGP